MKIKNIFILGVLISTSSAVLASSAPIIKTQPKSQTVNEGDSVTFTVVAEGGSGGNTDFSTPLSNSVNLDMVWIEPGTFMMGSPESEEGRGYDETQHQVTLTKGFWMGKYEITQAQYKAITGNDPSGFTGANLPVEQVSWDDAMEFCKKLTAKEQAAGHLPSGYEYTLPTEAQWEYACRAGTTGAYNVNGAVLSDLAWSAENSDGTTHSVGQKKPNAWGLYDMHGNVWEWCLDWYGDYSTAAVIDPTGSNTGGAHIIRSGDWTLGGGGYFRSAGYRWYYESSYTHSTIGLRVVLVSVSAQASAAADTLTYQWYKDGVVISGATGSSYTIKSVKTSDAGKYTVKVCNSVGCVTSEIATLTVNVPVTLSSITINGNSSVNVGSTTAYTCTATYSNGTTKTVTPTWAISSGTSYASITSAGVLTGKAAGTATVQAKYTDGGVTKTATKNVTVNAVKPTITTQPKSQTVNEGSNVTFSVTATGTSLNYQWYKGSSKISGATYSSYTISGVKNSDAGSYYVVVSNTAGSVTSSTVTLSVTAKPAITTQPKSQTVNEGSNVTFSVVATGTAPLSYQWKKNGSNISGATSSSYTISSAKTSDAGSYTVTVSNDAGKVTSSTATLTVTAKPTITTQPKSQTVNEGDSVTFSVTATGTGLKYQWKKGGSNISGATSSTYKISSAKSSDAGSYTVTVSNSAGSVTSSAATLTVNKQVVPDGTAVRSIRVDGLTATVTLKLTPNDAVNVYFVEETVPAIGTITPNDGGVYTASKNVIRWSFLDSIPREVSYTVTVSNNLDEVAYVSGEVAFDTTVKTITGDNELDFTIKTHPADTNEDFEISMLEISTYAVAWKLGQNWSREPVDIPMNYVSRAALIWVNGGDYIYDPSKAKPSCWVDATARVASVELASDNKCERLVSPMGDHSIVTLTILPREGISVYLVEEQLPVGVPLNVTDISEGGNYIPEKNVIRWSFLDGEIRMVEYTLEPKDGFTGTISLSGEVMFDEEICPIEGIDEVEFTAGPLIRYNLQPNNKLILYFTGTLYESEDMVNWNVVEDEMSFFIVDISKGKKFYRCVK